MKKSDHRFRSIRYYISLILALGMSQFSQAVFANSTILANWSQIIGNEQSSSSKQVPALKIMARFIISNAQNCSDFTAVGHTAGTARATNSGSINERTVSNNTSAFPIRVCQLKMGSDWDAATLFSNSQCTENTCSGSALAQFSGPHSVGRKNANELVVIGIGDTGCRAPDCIADKEINTRFKNVIQSVVSADLSADFILHMGDYRYYYENSQPDAWSKWYMEFFRPAQSLLNTTPIALIRGNHEECSGSEGYWYGERYFQFFEATESATVKTCAADTASLEKTWFFDVAIQQVNGTSELPHRVVMIDNSPDPKNFNCHHYSYYSATCDSFQGVVNSLTNGFSLALSASEHMKNDYSGDTSVWWAMHKPIWSYPNKYQSEGSEDALLRALGNTTTDSKPTKVATTLCMDNNCIVNTLFAGHAHMYQKIASNSDKWPTQYVLGHGGVQPLTGSDRKLVYDVRPPSDYQGHFQTYTDLIYEKNGFMILRRNKQNSSPDYWSYTNCILSDATSNDNASCHEV